MNQQYVDASRWYIKSQAVLAIVTSEVPKAVDWAHDDLIKEVKKNLSGWTYYPGKLPVRRVFGHLARSISKIRFSKLTRAVVSLNAIAHYNIHVHYGTKKVPARPFITDAANKRRPAYLNRFNYVFKKAVRRVGRLDYVHTESFKEFGR